MSAEATLSAPGRDRIRLKVCCIQSVAEALLAARLGADAIGLVSEMPSGPGVIPESLIAGIVAEAPRGVTTVLLTSRRDPAEIIAQQQRCGVNAIQLCDRLPAGSLAALHEALPTTWIIQVVHVTDAGAVVEAQEAGRTAQALLLDSGNPRAAVKELGGTGRTHDWELSRSIREAVDVPVLLAGGLDPGNVAEAVARVRPWGVDVCTGVRTDGRLDEDKLRRFVDALGGR